MNKLLKLFLFFTAFPCIKIFGVSITIFLFMAIIFSRKNIKIQFLKSKVFLFFFVAILISSVFSFFDDQTSHPGFFYILKICFQYLYWICVAIFFKKYFKSFNIIELINYFLLGLICLIISFFVLKFKLDYGFLSFNFDFPRNNFVFIILAGFPISYFYFINNKRLKKFTILLIFIFLLVIFLSQDRSGILILIIEIIFVSIIVNPKIKLFYNFVLALIIIAFLSGALNFFLVSLSNAVEPYNPRIAGFIRQDGESDFEQNKSLMLRLMMIDKTKEIFLENPFFGIGPNMFKYYKAPLDFRSNYQKLDYRDDDYINSRSSHGTYLHILSEFGILGFTLFLLIISPPILYLLKHLYNSKTRKSDIFLISLFGISLHFLSISAITGTIAWVIIGIAYSSKTDKQIE